MEEIIDIIIKVLAALLALGAGWLGKHLIGLVKTKLNAEQNEMLDLFIAELVAAAEQMFKKDDPDGSIRFEYVKAMLIEAGYEITDAVKALIEAKVFSINLANVKEVIIEEDVEGKPVLGFTADPEGGEDQ